MLGSVKHRSRTKGLKFDLDLEWVVSRLIDKTCEATGLEFELEWDSAKGRRTLANPFSPSIDRLDPKKGYTKDNCRLVIANYNFGKSSWTDETVLQVARAVLKNKTFGI